MPTGASVQGFGKGKHLEGKIDTVMDFVGTNQTFEELKTLVNLGG